MKRIHDINELLDRRRELRRRQTIQEEKLWLELRNRKLGVKFRRQHSIGYYIADFFCYEKRLVVEIDGNQHYSVSNIEYDKDRDSILDGFGYRVLRITNREIETDLQKVILKIKMNLDPTPLP